MPRFGLVGPSYASQSPLLDDQLCINWYCEQDESSAGNSPIAMYPTPGLKVFCDMAPLKHTSVRGDFTINGRSFGVEGANFNEVLSNGTFQTWGQIGNDALPVSFAASPQQMLIGSAGTAYVFDLGTNTLTAIPAATFAGPVAEVGICDDFFLVRIADSKEFYVSGVLDAFDWVSNGPAIVSVFPDNLVGMLIDHREIWFWSDTKSVVYFDSGAIFPFDVIPSAFIEAGLAAASSPVQLNNTVFWLGSDERGAGKVWQGYGYTPQRVSNHAIEFAMQSYAKISDAIGFAYQDQGHEFYVLYFPTPSVTWAYDVVTGMWHQRGYWVEAIGQFRAAHYQCHTFNFGKHLVGDWQSGKIYEMHIPVQAPGGAWSFADDDGNPIRRVRRAPHISREQKRQFFREMQVLVETGLGPQPPFLKGNGVEDTEPAEVGASVEGTVVGAPWQNPDHIASNTPGTYASVTLPQMAASPTRVTGFAATVAPPSGNTVVTTITESGSGLEVGDFVLLYLTIGNSNLRPVPITVTDDQGNVYARLAPDQLMAPFETTEATLSVWGALLTAPVATSGTLVITATNTEPTTAGAGPLVIILRGLTGNVLGFTQGTGVLSPDQPTTPPLATSEQAFVVALQGGTFIGPVTSWPSGGFTSSGPESDGTVGGAIATLLGDAGSYAPAWQDQVNGTGVPWGTTVLALEPIQSTNQSELLNATEYAFDLDASTAILGLQVEINGKQSVVAPAQLFAIGLIGSKTPRFFQLPIVDGMAIVGGPTDLWGEAGFSVAEIEDAGFGFSIVATSLDGTAVDFDVSGVVLGVWHTAPGTTIAQLARGPQMMMRYSNDSGKTWSNEYVRDCGQAGQNRKRVRWTPLGQGRDRIFEISVSDPIGWRVIDAYLDFVPGLS